jgi:multidrug efflux pump subunit AcrA (membrane-fusion protein)
VRPNTSAKAEIFVEEVKDVLYVPSQAVRKKEGSYYCFIDRIGDPEMREVTLGKSNDTHVVILSGLEEGDRALLAPPAVYDTADDQ